MTALVRKHTNSRVCIYPRVFQLPLGIFFLSVIVCALCIMMALAIKSWTCVFVAGIYLCAIYTLNIFFAGNFGWSKKRLRHQTVKTGLFVAQLNCILKTQKDAQNNKTVV